jgi:hypothetical protein
MLYLKVAADVCCDTDDICMPGEEQLFLRAAV